MTRDNTYGSIPEPKITRLLKCAEEVLYEIGLLLRCVTYRTGSLAGPNS